MRTTRKGQKPNLLVLAPRIITGGSNSNPSIEFEPVGDIFDGGVAVERPHHGDGALLVGASTFLPIREGDSGGEWREWGTERNN